MQLRSAPSLIAALAAIGLNLTPGLARADFESAMSGPTPVESRILAAEIGAFRDGAQSVRHLPPQINERVDRVQVRSGALLADLSAHEGKIDAARSEGVIMAMSDPSDLVVARLDGMLVAYELIDAQARLGTCTAPAMIPAGTLPNPTVLRMLVDERMGLPAGEASLAGYERMMAAWSDLGVSPAPAPIRDPDAEDRVREILQTHPELERFVSPDLIRSSPEERAERVRDLVAENPGLERFVPQDLIRSSPEERTERVRELVAENPGLERFVPPDLIRSSPEEVLIRALSGEGPVDDPFTPPRAGGPDLNP